MQRLIYIRAFRFTGKTKNELLVIAGLLLVNFTPENRDMLLLKEPIKEYNMPVLERSIFEDAFDEIELLSFSVSCTPFDLLQTKYRGSVMAKDREKYHNQEIRILAYLISQKHVPTKKGDMYVGTLIDIDGDYFDTTHFSDCLQLYPFQGGGVHYIIGTVEVNVTSHLYSN